MAKEEGGVWGDGPSPPSFRLRRAFSRKGFG